MANQRWVMPIGPFHTADGAAYASSTTLTDVGPTPSIVIPANYLEVGMRLEWVVFGRFSTTGTPTLTLGVYLGTGAIASGQAVTVTSALTTPSGVTNQTFRIEGNASVRAVGSGTSATIIGVSEVSNVTTTATNMAPATAPATLGFDSTIANKIMFGATWGTSSASNTLTCHYFDVRSVN